MQKIKLPCGCEAPYLPLGENNPLINVLLAEWSKRGRIFGDGDWCDGHKRAAMSPEENFKRIMRLMGEEEGKDKEAPGE